MSGWDRTEKIESSIGVMKHIRSKELEKLKEDQEFSRSLFGWTLDGTPREPSDDLGLPMKAPKPESAKPND